MQRFKDGKSGAYTEAYHNLLGKSSWIVVRNIERPGRSNNSDRNGSSTKTDSADAEDGACYATALSEGDVATIFSQFGEVIDVRFVRHEHTGRFVGTAFVRFEDYRSAILAADEMNSNHEKGKEVRLCHVGGSPPRRGIEVARCEDAEVCPLAQGCQSYTEWLSCLPKGVHGSGQNRA